MTDAQLSQIKAWFEKQVTELASPGETLHPFLQLKGDHSQRVARDARSIARELKWPPSAVNAAEAIGWLHDIGRFSQFSDFGTFSDASSVNHGTRGWEIARRAKVLEGLTGNDRECILDSIRYHNAKTIPELDEKNSLPYLQLIRDADKLDIFRVVRDAITKDGFRDLREMLPNMQLDGRPNPRLLREIEAHQYASLENVRSLADYLLMQLCWVYDINYSPTFKRLAERNIISDIARALPQGNGAVDSIVRDVRQFVAWQA